MGLPNHEKDGLLPIFQHFDDFEGSPVYRGHECTMVEIQAAFVDPYPDSILRPLLMQELRMLLAFATQYVRCLTLLVSGAFIAVEGAPPSLVVGLVIHPGPIDAVGFWAIHRLFDSREWEIADQGALVQTGLSREYEPDDRRFDLGRTEQLVLRSMAGNASPDRTSGYIELFECPEGVIKDAEDERATGIGNSAP